MRVIDTAAAADARSLSTEARPVKGEIVTLVDRTKWLVDLRDADHKTLVRHLRERDRPSKTAIIAVAAAMMIRAWGGGGRCMASIATLARDIGCSPSTISVVLAVLTKTGWLSAGRRRKASRAHDTTIYRFSRPSPESGGGTPDSGEGYPGVPALGSPESGEKRESEENLIEKARASWWRSVHVDDWQDLYHRYRADGEPFQSSIWKDIAWHAAGCPS
jgi:hypothetical protein